MVLFSHNESSLALTHILFQLNTHKVSPLVSLRPRVVVSSPVELRFPGGAAAPVEFTVSGFGEVENHVENGNGERLERKDSGWDLGTRVVALGPAASSTSVYEHIT